MYLEPIIWKIIKKYLPYSQIQKVIMQLLYDTA